jgi:hypothetical protein
VQNGLPTIAREVHPSFESLAIINAPSLQASLMDIHHDTSLRFTLGMAPFPQHPELTFVLVQAKGQGYEWLIGYLSIYFTLHTLLAP